MRSMARCTAGDGALSLISLQRRRMRARILSAVASGNCRPVMPREFQTMPQSADRRFEKGEAVRSGGGGHGGATVRLTGHPVKWAVYAARRRRDSSPSTRAR